MTLNAKNMVINVDENMEVNVGADMTESIGGNQTTEVGSDINISSDNYTLDVSQNSQVLVENKLNVVSGETSFVTESGDFTAQSAGVALIQGAEDARISKG